jgi:hypothetical protein
MSNVDADGDLTATDKFPLLMWHVHRSDKYNYVYVDTPKVACSTIKRTLSNAEQGFVSEFQDNFPVRSYGYTKFLVDIHDRRQSLLKWPTDRGELISLVERSRLTFAFVRNPYTRVLSAYLDKFGANLERRILFMKKLGIEDPGPSPEISFVEFLELAAKQEAGAMNAHWRPQSYHLIDDDICYDIIGRFEAFSRDFTDILARIDGEISKFFVVADEHKTGVEAAFSEHYGDPLCGRLVRQMYAEDFERFGYSDDLARALSDTSLVRRPEPAT